MSGTSMSGTSLTKHPLSPELHAELQGVTIQATPRPTRGSPLVIHGAFRVPWADAERIVRPRQRALVVVVQRGASHGAFTPFREKLLFEDDDQESRGGASGYFNVDVTELLGESWGKHHIFVTIGTQVSNVLEIDVK